MKANPSETNYPYLLTEDRSQLGDAAQARQAFFLAQIESLRNQASFIAFGIALLLPWNATLAAMDYFVEIFPLFKPATSFLLAVSIPMLGMQLVSFALQNVISPQVKLVGGLFFGTAVSIALTIVPQIVKEQSKCYYIVLGLMIAQGCAIAFL